MSHQFVGDTKFLLPIRNIVLKYPSSVFLFSGIEGIGKRKLASIICNNILHLNKSNLEINDNIFLYNESLYDKKSANLFKNNTHPDAFIIENNDEKIIPIEITRSLKKFLNSTSGISKNKVVIIDTIDRMSLSSLNMLLKSLEEPPNGTFIFLISHNSSQIIKTVQSRLFKFNFKPLNQLDYLKVFSDIKIENIKVEELKFLGTFFSYSPGLIIKYYNEHFIKNYENLIKFFINIIQPKHNRNIFKFIPSENKNNDEKLLIIFLEKILKLLFLNDANGQYFENLSILEKKLILHAEDSFLLSNLNEKYTKLQKDLFDAEKLNVNKNDLIDNFLTSFNF